MSRSSSSLFHDDTRIHSLIAGTNPTTNMEANYYDTVDDVLRILDEAISVLDATEDFFATSNATTDTIPNLSSIDKLRIARGY